MPGSTSDLVAMREGIEWISSSLPISEVIVVADRGMVSTENLKALEKAGIHYCVFRSISSSHSGANRPLVPDQIVQ
jgi:transposase